MPRPLRPIETGLVYHAINRGNNRADVLRDDADRDAFLAALADQKARRPFELLGYCMMTNHVHLLIRAREASISRVIQGLLVAHTRRHHRAHRSGGHVWQGRFRSPVVQDDDHLLTVLRYIEANPLRAGVVADAGAYRRISSPPTASDGPTACSCRSPLTTRSRTPRPGAGGDGLPSSIGRSPTKNRRPCGGASARAFPTARRRGSRTWVAASASIWR